MTNFRFLYSIFAAIGLSATNAHGEAVTYSKDVAPIVQRACQPCHRPNQIAPMSLQTYEQIRPWAKSIRKRVANREMPPWHSDPLVGEYVNNRSLRDEEIKTIVDWIDAGTPEGDRADLPEPKTWPDGWSIGQPDLVLSIDRPYRVPARGSDQFEYFSINTNMKEDRFVRAVEVRPGDPRVVHHVMAYIHQNDNYDFSEESSFQDSIGQGGTILTEYALGNNGDVYPEGTGRLLKRGARLWLEIHYHSYGEPTTDQTQIALQFFPKGEEPQRIITRWIGTRDLSIPPNRKDVRSTSSYTFRRPVYIISFQPHMHCRGQSMSATASYPDGRTEVIFNVPHYDFNWQTTYTYKTPLLLPAGTRVRVDAAHNNTRENPNNPDSNEYVSWGQQTSDEMMHLWTDFVYADEDHPRPVTDRSERNREYITHAPQAVSATAVDPAPSSTAETRAVATHARVDRFPSSQPGLTRNDRQIETRPVTTRDPAASQWPKLAAALAGGLVLLLILRRR